MKRILPLFLLLTLIAAIPSGAAPMKARVIQQYFAQDDKGRLESFEWTIKELEKCDESLDIIVLPEFSEVPGKSQTGSFIDNAKACGPRLLKTCAETARRCHSYVFAGAVDTELEVPRNTIFIYDREGNLVGKYYKQHLTRGEWTRNGLDKSYTEEWSEPYILDLEGVRFAFLTCYDFYFYENFANIARWKPDVIIGCSHQRSDTFRALDIINSFCAYNTGAYLVRCSVSMGLDSELGGCSCVVAPTGEILGTLRSEIATLDVTFDPKQKYLKPAGYGNPPALHSEYIEIGRRPWKYRPGGSAIVTPFEEAPEKRICARRGFSSIASESPLAALGAAVALGASEVGFDVWPSPEGVFITEGGVTLREILAKLSCHTIMNLRLTAAGNKAWDEALLKQLDAFIFAYDAQEHVYFTTGDISLNAQLAEYAPDIPRCLEDGGHNAVDEAVRRGCRIVQLTKANISQKMIDKAHSAGLRVNVAAVDSPKDARKYFEIGADTILTNEYQVISSATGCK